MESFVHFWAQDSFPLSGGFGVFFSEEECLPRVIHPSPPLQRSSDEWILCAALSRLLVSAGDETGAVAFAPTHQLLSEIIGGLQGSLQGFIMLQTAVNQWAMIPTRELWGRTWFWLADLVWLRSSIPPWAVFRHVVSLLRASDSSHVLRRQWHFLDVSYLLSPMKSWFFGCWSSADKRWSGLSLYRRFHSMGYVCICVCVCVCARLAMAFGSSWARNWTCATAVPNKHLTAVLQNPSLLGHWNSSECFKSTFLLSFSREARTEKNINYSD